MWSEHFFISYQFSFLLKTRLFELLMVLVLFLFYFACKADARNEISMFHIYGLFGTLIPAA